MENVREVTQEELRAELIEKAAEDDAFRARLIDDPKAVIEDVLGSPVPESVSVMVHEESATEAHLVLPPSARLGEADLQAVAGGSSGWRAYAKCMVRC